MENIIDGILLLLLIAGLIGYLNTRSKVAKFMKYVKVREDTAQAELDEAQRRRMVHEEDMADDKVRQHNSSFRAMGITPLPEKRRPRIAFTACIFQRFGQDQGGIKVGDDVICLPSMEPFCGEGRKKRERKQESRPTELDAPSPLFFGASADPEPSRPASHSSYSGHGGSFDGGGASGDWSSSSSSSSDSGSCSSSSSDSGSSSCSSSD